MAKTPAPFTMFALGYEAWRLWFEAATVVNLRMLRLMQGGAPAEREAIRMVQEKWVAGMMLGLDWAAGRGGSTPEVAARRTMLHYRRRVAANRRRLSG